MSNFDWYYANDRDWLRCDYDDEPKFCSECGCKAVGLEA